MNRWHLLLAPVTLVAGLTCCGNKGDAVGRGQTTSQHSSLKVVSLFAILADPQKFDGTEVQVQGFFSYDVHGHFLSPDLGSFANALGYNILILDTNGCKNTQELHNHGNPAVCTVRGMIDAKDRGALEHAPFACTLRITGQIGLHSVPP